MYIKQVIENRESWWGYFLTVILIVPIAVFLFSIPHGIILTSKAFGNEELMAKIASGDMTAMMSVLEPNLNLFLMLLPILQCYLPYKLFVSICVCFLVITCTLVLFTL